MQHLTRKHFVLILIAAVTLLAAFLRFYNLHTLPPGLFGDEALMVLDAQSVVQTRHYEVYFAEGQSQFGSHPVTIYLAILARWLMNGNPIAIRYAIAAVGVLNVPLLFWCLWRLFQLDYDETRSITLGLIGALIYAITFPVLVINRLGFETTTSVTPGLFMFGWLALGLRTGERRYYVLSGVALGLSLYTYYAARLYPVAIVLALAWVALVAGHAHWKKYAIRLAWIAAASVLVFAPLGFYFIQHPDQFFARAAVTGEQTLGQGGGALVMSLGNASVRTLASLSLNGLGDFIPRHNLPYRAVFDPFLSVLFWTGIVLALVRFRQRSSAVLISWMAAMLLPVILTFTLNHPHYTRMMPAMPAFAGLAAAGALALYDVLAQRSKALGYAVVGLGLTFSLIVTTYDYFVRWANDPSLYDAFQVGDWEGATLALSESQDHDVYLAPEILSDPAHATFILLLKDGPAQHFPGADCLLYQDKPARPLTYMVDALNDKTTFDTVARRFPTGHEGLTVFHPSGWPLYQVYEVPAGAETVPPQTPVNAAFSDELKLIGYDLLSDSVQSGGQVTLTLYWQALRDLTNDNAVFVHIYPPAPDSDFLIPPIAQSDGFPCNGRYATSRLNAGEIVTDTRTITLPHELPAGPLTVAVGVYEWTTVQRLEIKDTGAQIALPENRLRLTELAPAPQ